MNNRRRFLKWLGIGAGVAATAPALANPLKETQYEMKHQGIIKSPGWMGGQKFCRGQRVKLANVFPENMSHFSGKGSEAIVEYSYNDRYGGSATNKYFLLILGTDKYYSRPHKSGWYPEKLMTLVSSDTYIGKQMILDYEIEHRKRTP